MVKKRPGHFEPPRTIDRPDTSAAVHDEATLAQQEATMKQPDLAADRLASEMAELQQSSAAQSATEAAVATDVAETPQPAPQPEPAPMVSEQPTVDHPDASPPTAATPDRIDPPPSASKVATILLPAITGAVAAALVAGAAFNGMIPGLAPPPATTAPSGDSAALNALAARVASIESRPAPLPVAASAAPASPDPALAGRIDALDKTVASLRDDLNAARSQSEQLANAIGALKLTTADTGSAAPAAPASDLAPDLAAINGRLDQLERAVAAAKEAAREAAENRTVAKAPEPAPAVAAPADDVPLRRIVAATLLDLAVRNGEPFAGILGSAKPLAADAAVLSSLDAFAAAGVPGAAALCRELVPLLPNLLPAAQAPGSGANFVDRLQANAERLVKIQRADAVAGIDRAAIVSRTAAAAQRNDLAAARDELKALAPADRKPVQSWIDKVEARDRALAASRQFAAAALAALPKTSP